MTRAYLGLALLDALVLGAGAGLAAALGLIRSGRSFLRHAGLAFVLGWAALGIVWTILLVCGLSLAWWQVTIAALATAAAGVALARRTSAVVEPARPPAGAAWPLAALSGAVVVVYLEELGRRAFAAGAGYHGDAWTFWLPKAKTIVLFGGLDTGPGGTTSFLHADYPPLVPAFDAVAFRFMGGLHASVLPVQEWILATAFVAAVAGLLVRRVPPHVLWPCLALLVLCPSFPRWLGVGLADEPLAILLALAAVSIALWLDEPRGAYVAVAAVVLAAASVTKTEGRALALLLAFLAVVACARELGARRRGLIALVLAPLLAGVPWRIWVGAHDVPITPDYRLRDALDPAYLADHADRLGKALELLPKYLAGGDDLLIVLPLAVTAGVLVAVRAPRLALLAAGAPLLSIAALLLVYWIGTLPVDYYVDTSAERTVLTPLLLAGVLLPLALARLLVPAAPVAGAEGPPRREEKPVEGPVAVGARDDRAAP